MRPASSSPENHHRKPTFTELPPEAFVRLREVLCLVPLCRAAVYEKVQRRAFPAPVKLTAHASGWRVGDIRAWLENPTGWRPAGERTDEQQVRG